MAGPLVRVAAGAGTFVVIVTTGGAGIAVSAADPGGSRSPSSHSRDGVHSDGHSNARERGHPGWGNESRNGDRRRAPGRETDGVEEGSATGTVAGRAAPEVSVADTGSMPTSRVSAQQVTSSALPEVASDEAPNAAPRVPATATVTVGNGRSPRFPSGRPDEVPDQVAPASLIVVPPVAPPPSLPPAPLPSIPSPPVERAEAASPALPVSSFGGTLRRGWPVGVLFGIAGLLLAPMAGVWLGHRQARAVKAAYQLARH